MRFSPPITVVTALATGSALAIAAVAGSCSAQSIEALDVSASLSRSSFSALRKAALAQSSDMEESRIQIGIGRASSTSRYFRFSSVTCCSQR